MDALFSEWAAGWLRSVNINALRSIVPNCCGILAVFCYFLVYLFRGELPGCVGEPRSVDVSLNRIRLLGKTGGTEINHNTFCEKNCYEGFKSNSPNNLQVTGQYLFSFPSL